MILRFIIILNHYIDDYTFKSHRMQRVNIASNIDINEYLKEYGERFARTYYVGATSDVREDLDGGLSYEYFGGEMIVKYSKSVIIFDDEVNLANKILGLI